jgi:hypothetical protein
MWLQSDEIPLVKKAFLREMPAFLKAVFNISCRRPALLAYILANCALMTSLSLIRILIHPSGIEPEDSSDVS